MRPTLIGTKTRISDILEPEDVSRQGAKGRKDAKNTRRR
jgi:hypothetical protein